MNKIFTLLIIGLFAFSVKAQQTTPTYQPYGKIDRADLEMKACDFEPDANAEVLFDVNIMSPTGYTVHHKRIKIFNDNGKNEANIRLFYISFGNFLLIPFDIQAEVINLENGKVVITPVDKKLIYKEKINSIMSAIAFAIPNVKAGSIIEYQYQELFQGTWYFQSNLPTRYSEFQTALPLKWQFRFIPHITQPYAKNIGDLTDAYQTKALANVPSLQNEPYMSPRDENLQRMEFINMNNDLFNTWPKIAEAIVEYPYFYNELNRNLTGEKDIIKQAKSLKTDEDKIAFIFDTVKTAMKWNNITDFFTKDGTVKAWDNKTGNSAEINLILYDLLKKSGIKAYPLMVGSKNKSKINPINANFTLLSNTVVYVQVDSSNFYILDATNKFSLYNVVPKDELNTFGLLLDKDNYRTIFLENEDPVMRSVFLNAEIKPSGKMEGTAQINTNSYSRINDISHYKTDGETKYLADLSNNDNNLKITSIKMENMNIDTLPLVQNIDFKLDLSGSDNNYIYFNPNLFTSLGKNPFTSETRNCDIDFGYKDNVAINGIFKIPAGYTIDALPKNVNMNMPDTSITFRRVINQQDGTITVRYVINHKKTIYFKEQYPEFYEFYKKMYEMLNEQIVLKKS